MRFRPGLPSPSMAVAMTALFVALGGTGYAATQLPGGPSDVHAAKKKKKKPACLASVTPLCSSLKASVDQEIVTFAAAHQNQLRGPQGPAGPAGPAGTNGTNGTNGANGTNGTNGATNVVVRTISGPVSGGGGGGGVVVPCNAGERAVGGGVANPSSITTTNVVNQSGPTTNGAFSVNGETPTGWSTSIENMSPSTETITFYAICASP